MRRPPPLLADYRVPVVLREMGVLRYSPDLAAAVDGRQQLAAGGQAEVEIRAASVAAVELVSSALQCLLCLRPAPVAGAALPMPCPQPTPALQLREAVRAQLVAAGRAEEAAQLNSVLLDWTLWEQGERSRSQHRPHHRVLTIFY